MQYVRLSSLHARYTDGFVFSILRISPGMFWVHVNLNVPPKMDYMKHATTSDHAGVTMPDFSGGCLRHAMLWCV